MHDCPAFATRAAPCRTGLASLLALAWTLAACGSTGANQRVSYPTAGAVTPSATGPEAAARPEVPDQTGRATWYSDSLAGRHTASGEPYEPSRLTAAHRTLPFGTRVLVTRTDNGRAVEVVVNDRGPFGDERRIIDLSRAAATELRMLRAGVVPVRVHVLELGNGRRRRHHHHRRHRRHDDDGRARR